MKRWYFVTDKWLGRSPTLLPYTPANRCEGESDTPRICVAATVADCYLGIHGCAKASFDPYHVYMVETDAAVRADKTVHDRKRTGEHWLLEPTKFRHVLKMPKIQFSWNYSCHEPYRVGRVRDEVGWWFAVLLREKRERRESTVARV